MTKADSFHAWAFGFRFSLISVNVCQDACSSIMKEKLCFKAGRLLDCNRFFLVWVGLIWAGPLNYEGSSFPYELKTSVVGELRDLADSEMYLLFDSTLLLLSCCFCLLEAIRRVIVREVQKTNPLTFFYYKISLIYCSRNERASHYNQYANWNYGKGSGT